MADAEKTESTLPSEDLSSPRIEASTEPPKARNPITVSCQHVNQFDRVFTNPYISQWTLIIAAILSTIFLFALDNTITADVIPAVIGSLGQADKLPWLSVAYATAL